jgi:hypothetical protein
MKFGFTRDSVVWWFGIVAALLVAGATLQTCDPHVAQCGTSPTMLSYYGIPDSWAPYIRLGAFIVGIVSGVMRTSPRPHSEEGSAKITASGK